MPQTIARGLTHAWTYRQPPAPDGADLVSRILAVRGITDGTAPAFLEPSLNHLHDPSLLPGMDAAAERVLSAIAGGERVVIYGDYDVDGITATAILYHTLRAIDPACGVGTYVPHRLEEGYGLNAEALRQLAAEGARLVISVDCGVTAAGPARAAREAGLDLIITDHHNLPEGGEPLPEACAIVHPRLPGSAYPFGHLSGAGVAYKLAWRLLSLHAGGGRVHAHHRELLVNLLGFAALGTIADVVPLVGENRVLARFGLGRIKHSPFPGLRALVEAAGLAGENIDAEHAGFALGPRLNAAGRLGHAREAVELFTSAPPERHAEIARNLTRLNDQRRATELRIAEQAAEMAAAAGMTAPDRRAIVLAHEDWHQGVVGIVCSRLVDRFCRPTILMQRREGRCYGSGRSVAGFSLHGALTTCAGRLARYGGHDMAAGLELEDAELGGFAEEFTACANAQLAEDDLVPKLTLDADARLPELTAGAVGRLECLAPFGMANPRVRVRISGARLSSRPMPVGSGGQHVALTVSQDGRAMRMLGWRWAERAGGLPAGVDLDMVISPKLSAWNGVTSVEPEIVDLAVNA
ncbi:MAG: single-stranded-DNA-specific exonuclease RecJ [Phycisphaerales bacterium]